MGRPYSLDLRERVVGAMGAGMSSYVAAKHYAVSESSAARWARRDRETGSPAPLPMGGKRPFALAGERDWVLGRIAEQPDLPLRALLAELRDRGIAVSYYAVWNIIDRSGLSFKKKSARQRAGSPERRAPAGAMEKTSRQD